MARAYWIGLRHDNLLIFGVFVAMLAVGDVYHRATGHQRTDGDAAMAPHASDTPATPALH